MSTSTIDIDRRPICFWYEGTSTVDIDRFFFGMNPHRRSISTEFLLKSTVDTTSIVFSSRRIRIDRRYRTYSQDAVKTAAQWRVSEKTRKGMGKSRTRGTAAARSAGTQTACVMTQMRSLRRGRAFIWRMAPNMEVRCPRASPQAPQCRGRCGAYQQDS